jgi:uncharacterized membrane-anchored protein
MEEQNSEILKSLNSRADAQIKIQRAVEGLSIIAITYYQVNLLKLGYWGLQDCAANPVEFSGTCLSKLWRRSTNTV